MREWTAAENLGISPKFHVAGYEFRTVVAFDDVLYDPHLANWIEEDGSLVICDVGGQPRPGWDPTLGHGALWRLRPDNRLEVVIPWGRMHRGPGFYPRLVPRNFGRWGGQAFIVSQLLPGRDGAHYDHILHKWDRRSDILEPFAIFPRSSSAVGEGLPSAPAIGEFGPPGSAYEGGFYTAMMRNNTVYKVTPDGKAQVIAVCDGVKNKMILPRVLCFGSPDNFPSNVGDLIIGGIPDAHFTAPRKGGGQEIAYHRIRDGVMDDDPIAVGNRMLARPLRAPPNFGALSGNLLYSDQGETMQSQVHYDRQALPHDATIFYRTKEGALAPFLSGLRGGFNDFIFRDDRLVITHFGKSYSTGEFHEPDGAVWEVSVVR